MTEAAMNLNGTEYKSTYNGEEVTVPIPAGFAVSGVEGENTVEDGLVIIDSEGNEFVWIPVNKENFYTDFKRIEGYMLDGNLENKLSITYESSNKSEDTPFEEASDIKKEAQEIYDSVYENGGFYIGRYETGKDNYGNAVVKKNMPVFNNINWGNSEFDTTGGAVEISRKLCSLNDSVCSTLCYGVEWDAALNFIDSNFIKSKCDKTSYVVDATGKGWSSENYLVGNKNHLTGIDIDSKKSNCQKNIYDMAGNVSELTMEVIKQTDKEYYTRVRRGSGFDFDKCMASNRDRAGQCFGGGVDYIGFRIALYLK